MRFQIPDDSTRLAGYIPAFVDILTEKRWLKRSMQLSQDVMRSPWSMKIVVDYYWLEMELSALSAELVERGSLCAPVCLPALAALRFAAAVVEVHKRLTVAGQKSLEGRLRDGLRAGFAAIYLEIDLALLLMQDGFDVVFPDLEGWGRVDLQFDKPGVEGQIECKSQSADAGRKIHRRHFYRFIDRLSRMLLTQANTGMREVILITLHDRFPDDDNLQRRLADAIAQMLADRDQPAFAGDWFSVERQQREVVSALQNAASELHAACRKMFGDNCHVAGPIGATGICLIVARSSMEDDTSKPLLEAMKEAHEQLRHDRPGFIAVQFNDIEPQSLVLPHLRRRAEVLSASLFTTRDSARVAGVYFCTYQGLWAMEGRVGTPAFVCWNPALGFPIDHLPFKQGVSDEQFATILGVRQFASNADAAPVVDSVRAEVRTE
jgi:hypothetical protein